MKMTITREIVPDIDPDPSYLEQEGFEDRLAEYKRGDFGYCGVRAVATIETDEIINRVRSPGLWGIEDDSSDEYLNEIFEEEKTVLLKILESMKGVET